MIASGRAVPGHDAADRQSHEHVRTLERLGESARLGFGCEAALVLIEVRAAGVNHTCVIAHQDVLALDPQAHVMLRRRERRRTGP